MHYLYFDENQKSRINELQTEVHLRVEKLETIILELQNSMKD